MVRYGYSCFSHEMVQGNQKERKMDEDGEVKKTQEHRVPKHSLLLNNNVRKDVRFALTSLHSTRIPQYQITKDVLEELKIQKRVFDCWSE